VSAIRLAQNHLNRALTRHITILSSNPSPTLGLTQANSTREFCSTLTQTLSAFRNTKVHIDWFPSRPKSVGIKRWIELAHNNAANPLPPYHRKPHSHLPKGDGQRTRSCGLAGSLAQRRQALPSLPCLPQPPLGNLPRPFKAQKAAPVMPRATLVRLLIDFLFSW
jgi:hypothetical protein